MFFLPYWENISSRAFTTTKNIFINHSCSEDDQVLFIAMMMMMMMMMMMGDIALYLYSIGLTIDESWLPNFATTRVMMTDGIL